MHGKGGTSSNSPIELNVWHHLLFSFDGQTDRFYIDGELVSIRDDDPYNDTSTNFVKIGHEANHPTRYWKGDLDEIMIWDRALYDWEISQLYDIPVAHWKFDEGMHDGECCSDGGDIVYDSSDNEYHGTIYGGRDEWVEGINGSALRFEAGTDYVVVNDDGETSLASEKFTISVWFIWDDLDSNETQFLIGKGEEHYEIHTGENNGIMFIPAGHPETHIYVEEVIHSGWNHVVVTYDDTQSLIYFDGILVASRNITSSAAPDDDEAPLFFGRRDGHSESSFEGIMDEIAIWNRALSSEEILELYFSPMLYFQI